MGNTEDSSMIEMIEERGHLLVKRSYDERTLELVCSSTEAKPGFRLNGHQHDCRCEICRPDIWRLPCE